MAIPSFDDVLSRVLRECAALLGVAPAEILPDSRFVDLGIDSLGAVRVLEAIGREMGQPIRPTLVWEYPTPKELALALSAAEPIGDDTARASLTQLDPGVPIAVVGMSCRFPGARGPDAYWRLLNEGVDAVREIPEDRWDDRELYDSDPSRPGRAMTRWGGFLDDAFDFDAAFFDISPREALQMDPQQRWMLELSWEALEDAGIPADALRGAKVSVYSATMWNEYDKLFAHGIEAIDQHSAVGRNPSIAPARVSYALGLRGPCVAVNTACSSSLVAVHLACQSIRNGESRLSIVGGMNAILTPHTTVEMSKFGGMSPDGRCKTFDARADGYVRAEGGGVVVLKRFDHAVRDGDPIYAVVRGSAVNNDGGGNGISAPNVDAQIELLETAYEMAGVEPTKVHYVEAHGTGTFLGDPIEARAVGTVLGGAGRRAGTLRVGSCKTNVGHLESAAGIAGLIKTLLSMKHDTIAPNLHFETPNPHIPFEELAISVPVAPTDWGSGDETKLAGVSSFGFGGTNAHLVLEGPSSPVSAPAVTADAHESGVVFVFGGNGSQWRGMGRDLLLSDAGFRRTVSECDAIFHRLTDVSIAATLLGERAQENISDVLCSQMELFALQVGIAELFRERSLEAAAVCGHSVGEIAAAHVASALSLEDACRAVVAQAQAQSRVPGTMVAVRLPRAELEARLNELEDLYLAAENGPKTSVVAGTRASIEDWLLQLRDEGVDAREVRIDFPAHSPLLRPVSASCKEALTDIVARDVEMTIVSTVTGAVERGSTLTADYWARNLVEPIRMVEAVQTLLELGHRSFVEIGPHPLLSRGLREIFSEKNVDAAVVASLERSSPARTTINNAVAAIRDSLHSKKSSGPTVDARRAHILTLSAKDEKALDARLASVRETLEREPDLSLDDLCWSRSVRSSHLAHRAAVVFTGREDLVSKLDASAAGTSAAATFRGADRVRGTRRVGFVFSGQGSQSHSMGAELYRTYPVFRAALHECDAALAPHLAFSVAERVRSGASNAQLADPAVIQPTLFAIQVALSKLSKDFGIEAEAVLGHSMGEVAAAHVCGIVDLDDAARIICARSELLSRLRGQGRMIAVEGAAEDVSGWLAASDVSIAVVNSKSAVVLSGSEAAIDAVSETLDRHGYTCRDVAVDVPAHSACVEPLLDELRAALAHVSPHDGDIPFYSSVRAEVVPGALLDADYWARNLRDTVRFSETFEHAVASGVDTFVELAPRPVLLPALADVAAERRLALVPSLRRDVADDEAWMEAIATLYVSGVDVRFEARYPNAGKLVNTGTYPWQRRSFRPSPSMAPDWRARSGRADPITPGTDEHPFLGPTIESSVSSGAYSFDRTLDPATSPLLLAHRVRGTAILGAGIVVDMMLAAASRVKPGGAATLRRVELVAPLRFGPGARHHVQLAVSVGRADTGEASLSVRRDTGWELLARATVDWSSLESSNGSAASESMARSSAASDVSPGRRVTAGEHYRRLSAVGVDYGLALHSLAQLEISDGCIVGELDDAALAVRASSERPCPYEHFDAALQAALSSTLADGGGPVVVSEIDEVRVAGIGGVPSRVVADRGARSTGESRVESETGQTLLSISGIVWKPLPREHDGLSALTWKRADAVTTTRGNEGSRYLVLLTKHSVAAELGAELRALGTRCEEAVTDGETGIPRTWGFDRIVDARHLEAEGSSPDAIERSVVELAELAKELVQRGEGTRLSVLTRGVARIDDADRARPALGSLHAFVRVLRSEHPELDATVIDVGANDGGSATSAALARELSRRQPPASVALRGPKRFLSELGPASLPAAGPRRRVATPATILVTGGLGAIGTVVARHLAARYTANLVLVGRRAPSDAARAAIESMSAVGASVRIVAADVSSPGDVDALISSLENEDSPLTGIVHAAGVVDDALIRDLDTERVHRVFAPKVHGAWNLHRRTEHLDLDFFVLFGSVGGSIGIEGQAAYAAANASLDDLAQHRAALGLPACTVGWTAWDGLGFATTPGGRIVIEELASRSIRTLALEPALAILDDAIEGALPPSVVTLPGAIGDPSSRPDAIDEQSTTRAATLASTLAEESSVSRRRSLVLDHVRGELAAVLRAELDAVDPEVPMRTLGLDSMMAVELSRALSSSLGLSLPRTLAFSHPSALALAEHLEQALGRRLRHDGASRDKETSRPADETDIESLAEQLEQLSPEQARSLLGDL